ncbi:MAG: type IX secretion system membrane protein PorP/SprF [Flavobacteriales bacterium]|nr:type IX secretion system membrane protein PorP/SprF [Flavobacteriales bacterium]
MRTKIKNTPFKPTTSGKMKKYIAIFILMISFVAAQSQQEVMISQYMFNGLVLNPAYAGTHPYWSGSILHRSQWVKFDKAPKSQTLCLDGPIANGKLGVGLNLSNDAIGITNQLDIGGNVATRVSLGAGFLSMGLRVGVTRYSANLTDAIIRDTEDPVYAQNINGTIVPRFGAGLYYYQRNWFAGVSVPSLLAIDENVSYNSAGLNSFYKSHVYINGGFVFEPSPEVAIKPSVLLKVQGSAPVELDLNLNALFLNKFWVGAGYRTGDAMIAMVEWNITHQLPLGYAFDYTLTSISDYSSNSHEVMLGYDFGKDVDLKARSPRYF